MLCFIPLQSFVTLFAFDSTSGLSHFTRSSNAPEPVAFFPLNGKYGAKEVKSRFQGYPGIVDPAPGPSGEPEGSLQLINDMDSFIRLVGLDNLWTTSFTVSCWVYPEQSHVNIMATKLGHGGFHLQIENWMLKSLLRFQYASYSPLYNRMRAETNKWAYVALTYNYNTGIHSLWVNGSPITQNLPAKGQMDPPAKFQIGVINKNIHGFRFRIAQLKFYDVALSADQIEATKNVGVDECQVNNPCKFGGKCTSIDGGYGCECPRGLSGKNCEEDINECTTTKPCKNGAKCINILGGYQCECPAGFIGANCEKGTNLCETESPCKNGATCVDSCGGYVCVCPPGFKGRDCDEVPVNQPTKQVNSCVLNNVECLNGGTCVPNGREFECHCAGGFAGEFCETKEVNGCVLSNVECFNGGTCVPNGREFECQCAGGFAGKFCAWKVMGCFEESPKNKDKAMAQIFHQYKSSSDIKTIVKLCLKEASKSGIKVVGIRRKSKCMTTKGDSKYDRHGGSNECEVKDSVGVGLGLANYFYVLKE